MVLSLDSFMNDKHQHLPSHCLAANAQTSHVTCQEAEREDLTLAQHEYTYAVKGKNSGLGIINLLKREELWIRNYQSIEFGANKHS